jgi:hypothetical protein
VTVLGFTVTFHGPFRVGSAYARDGVDAALDRHDPLPPDHIKGLMRAAAADILGLGLAGVGEVFGSPAGPSPWSWSAAQPLGDWEFSYRNRVTIDPVSRSALKDHLVLGEQAWAARARFEVSRAGPMTQDAADRHVLVLRCAAAAVHGLGSWRRRGLGWVGIVPDGGPVSAEDVAAMLSLAGGRNERACPGPAPASPDRR